MLAALAAMRASLALLLPGQWHPQPLLLGPMALRFLNQSVLAGIEDQPEAEEAGREQVGRS